MGGKEEEEIKDQILMKEKGKEGKRTRSRRCTYCLVIFIQLQVIPTQLHTENYCCNPLETVDPLFAFRSLSTHIHHFESQLFEGELIFYNPCGHVPRPQNIFHGGDVVQGRDALQVVQVVGGVVLQVVLVGAAETLLHARVCPQPLHHPQQLRGDLPFALSWACQGKKLHCIVRSVGIVKFYLEGGQSPNDTCERVNCIIDNQGFVFLTGLQVKATAVNDFHLLYDSALPRVAGAQEEEFDLSPLSLALRAQVAVNPSGPPRRLFLLRALPTSHGTAGRDRREGADWLALLVSLKNVCAVSQSSCQGHPNGIKVTIQYLTIPDAYSHLIESQQGCKPMEVCSHRNSLFSRSHGTPLSGA